jgi:hypothetical protein
VLLIPAAFGRRVGIFLFEVRDFALFDRKLGVVGLCLAA